MHQLIEIKGLGRQNYKGVKDLLHVQYIFIREKNKCNLICRGWHELRVDLFCGPTSVYIAYGKGLQTYFPPLEEYGLYPYVLFLRETHSINQSVHLRAATPLFLTRDYLRRETPVIRMTKVIQESVRSRHIGHNNVPHYNSRLFELSDTVDHVTSTVPKTHDPLILLKLLHPHQ